MTGAVLRVGDKQGHPYFEGIKTEAWGNQITSLDRIIAGAGTQSPRFTQTAVPAHLSSKASQLGSSLSFVKTFLQKDRQPGATEDVGLHAHRKGWGCSGSSPPDQRLHPKKTRFSSDSSQKGS